MKYTTLCAFLCCIAMWCATTSHVGPISVVFYWNKLSCSVLLYVVLVQIEMDNQNKVYNVILCDTIMDKAVWLSINIFDINEWMRIWKLKNLLDMKRMNISIFPPRSFIGNRFLTYGAANCSRYLEKDFFCVWIIYHIER